MTESTIIHFIQLLFERFQIYVIYVSIDTYKAKSKSKIEKCKSFANDTQFSLLLVLYL